MNIQPESYDWLVAQKKAISLRLSTNQLTLLNRLSAKLQLDVSNVIRLAVAKLAESEGLTPKR